MKTNSQIKLVAAMSGGVDSSVVAALMKEKGYQIIGVTLKLIDCDGISQKKKSCCGLDDRRLVTEVSRKLGIEHYFLDMREIFEEKVLKKCWEEYSAGKTPNPCVFCNRYIKFEALIRYALDIGAGGIITGHYAKIAKTEDGGVSLYRGDDSTKDQSYFLSLVKAEDLALCYTPLASYVKSQVRKIAEQLSLPNAEKKESQDACVGLLGANFAETLRIQFNGKSKLGNIIDENGTILAAHNGIHNFTIGQRRGFGRGFQKPVFVTAIDSESANITISSDQSKLYSSEFYVKDINWLIPSFIKKKSFEAFVQIRYRSKPAEAKVFPQSSTEAKVSFINPQRAITPGQIAAFYDNDKVIGAGVIEYLFP